MNTLTASALQQRHSSTLRFPADVPPPKFHLFQKVRYNDRIGIISGMNYIDFATAVTMGSGGYGWEYTVNFVLSPPPSADPIPASFDPFSEVWEDHLELVEAHAAPQPCSCSHRQPAQTLQYKLHQMVVAYTLPEVFDRFAESLNYQMQIEQNAEAQEYWRELVKSLEQATAQALELMTIKGGEVWS